MAQTDTKHFNVLKNGKLTQRISAIIDHYRGQGVNVEDVLYRERTKLNDKLVTINILGEAVVKEEQREPVHCIKAKIQAIDEILSVLNS